MHVLGNDIYYKIITWPCVQYLFIHHAYHKGSNFEEYKFLWILWVHHKPQNLTSEEHFVMKRRIPSTPFPLLDNYIAAH